MKIIEKIDIDKDEADIAASKMERTGIRDTTDSDMITEVKASIHYILKKKETGIYSRT